MINFWVNAANAFSIEEFIRQRVPRLGERVTVRHYESLAPDLEVSRGAHVFTALDQLTPSGREVVIALYDQVAGRCPGDPLLNDPRRVLGRYDLLREMHRAGINQYRVRRTGESLENARFPVFVREETGHDGALTGLLETPRDVALAIRSLRARGFRTADLLVVEFCDVSGTDGLRRMAATFRIGPRIVPSHLLRGTEWMLKWHQSDKSAEALRELEDHVVGTAHEQWVRQAFELGGVEYGRLDYGVRGASLQVWEINTGPTVGPSRGPAPPPYAPEPEAIWQRARMIYARAIADAFVALDPDQRQERETVHLPARLVTRALAEMEAVRRRTARLGVLRRIYAHPLIGKPFRAMYSWLAPRK